ncbi:hypothetical protein CTI12_AA302090 [Artemisia annua]|uniref:Uncharacterized protein n=1 Tax=Artemisia annua TaxID=35608 RepID=A0A2U1N662_ARTAN|nr:hypothetical protein CTI12_AA302090 [Artemisia annua]
MSWMGHFQVNVDENEIYDQHNYICNGESVFETDKVFSSREELLDWVRKTGFSLGYVIVIKTSKSNETTPSKTSVGDPTTQKTTRGRPSCKKTHFEPPLQAQEPLRPTRSSIPKPPKPSNSSFPKQATHAYINQFPKMFHAFTDRLEMHRQQYVTMFGIDGCDRVQNRLDFFNIDEPAPIDNWMSMPEIGILIASHFNLILHTITNSGSQTYLPLRSSPPPWYQHTFISLGFVNNGHYVNILLKKGYPVPTVTQHWFYFKSECATAWITPYMERINNYTQLLNLNRTFQNVNID